jgi:hypothetical protein
MAHKKEFGVEHRVDADSFLSTNKDPCCIMIMHSFGRGGPFKETIPQWEEIRKFNVLFISLSMQFFDGLEGSRQGLHIYITIFWT